MKQIKRNRCSISHHFVRPGCFFAENHYNGECLKTLPKSRGQDRHEIFSNFFLSDIRGSDDKKVRQKITMMATGSNRSRGPNKMMGKKYFQSLKFWPKNCPGVSFSETYSGK